MQKADKQPDTVHHACRRDFETVFDERVSTCFKVITLPSLPLLPPVATASLVNAVQAERKRDSPILLRLNPVLISKPINRPRSQLDEVWKQREERQTRIVKGTAPIAGLLAPCIADSPMPRGGSVGPESLNTTSVTLTRTISPSSM